MPNDALSEFMEYNRGGEGAKRGAENPDIIELVSSV
jgi:hypothetical protein